MGGFFKVMLGVFMGLILFACVLGVVAVVGCMGVISAVGRSSSTSSSATSAYTSTHTAPAPSPQQLAKSKDDLWKRADEMKAEAEAKAKADAERARAAAEEAERVRVSNRNGDALAMYLAETWSSERRRDVYARLKHGELAGSANRDRPITKMDWLGKVPGWTGPVNDDGFAVPTVGQMRGELLRAQAIEIGWESERLTDIQLGRVRIGWPAEDTYWAWGPPEKVVDAPWGGVRDRQMWYWPDRVAVLENRRVVEVRK